MSKSLIIVFVAALLMASTSRAERLPTPDYSRPGWYLGVGGGIGIDVLDDAIQDRTGGVVELSVGGSFNVRGGYRVTSWLAFEIMYEGVYGTEVQVSGMGAADLTTHSLTGNLKLILPTWRVQPYIMLAPGAQYGNFNGKGPLDFLDTARWDFMLRTAIGIDAYITENWLVNLELAPSIRFADYVRPSETTDNVTLTLGLGVQYRW